jgi:hypothetical protein
VPDLIFTKEQLWVNQAPSFNFEKDEDELLHQALLSGFVDEIGKNQYRVNLNYPEPRSN